MCCCSALDGSGQDRLFPVLSKSGEAYFGFTDGKTTDDRPHVKLFAIPCRAKVKVTLKAQ